MSYKSPVLYIHFSLFFFPEDYWTLFFTVTGHVYIRDCRRLQCSVSFSFLIGRFVLSSTVFSTSQALWQITHMLNLCVFFASLRPHAAFCLSQRRKTKSPQLQRRLSACVCQGDVRCAVSHQQRIAAIFGPQCWQTMNDSDLRMRLRTSARALIPLLIRCQQKPVPRGDFGSRYFWIFALNQSVWALKAPGVGQDWVCRWKETTDTKGHSRSAVCTLSGSVGINTMRGISSTWEYLKNCISHNNNRAAVEICRLTFPSRTCRLNWHKSSKVNTSKSPSNKCSIFWFN